MPDTIALAAQVVIALGIFNVWLLRFGKPSRWRGGAANDMKEEFRAYGLPVWFMHLIGFVKVLLAVLLIAGIWMPGVTRPAAIGMAVLMAGAVVMHFRVGDPAIRSLPAASLLALSLFVAAA